MLRSGLVMSPVPFFPYNGFTAFFAVRFTFPVVRAFKLFFRLGFLKPIFMIVEPFPVGMNNVTPSAVVFSWFQKRVHSGRSRSELDALRCRRCRALE